MELKSFFQTQSREWFIKGNIPSSKNSKVAVAGKGVFSSKTVKAWLGSLGIQTYSSSKKLVKGYKTRPNLFLKALEGFVEPPSKPYFIGIHFVRKTKARYDFNNVTQILADLLVAHNLIADDDTTIVYFVPYLREGRLQTFDKDNPGAYLTILEWTN